MISSVVLSPTARASFSRGAWVQPQPGLTFTMRRLSVPAACSQNTWLTFTFCGTKPKSNSGSGISSRGVGSVGSGDDSVGTVFGVADARASGGLLTESAAVEVGASSLRTVHPPATAATATRRASDQKANCRYLTRSLGEPDRFCLVPIAGFRSARLSFFFFRFAIEPINCSRPVLSAVIWQ